MALLPFKGTPISWICVSVILLVSTALHARPAKTESGRIIARNDVTSLCESVEKMKVVALKYYYDPDTAPERKLHPYAVGYTPSQNIIFFGLQVDGYSKSGGSDSTKGWRNFRADRINRLTAFDTTFVPVQPEFPTKKVIVAYVCKNKLAR
jgi:hypothetical protein